ncbi:nucleotide exchange factor GrpE [bacterium]|nr:nucleotide exchange factor GrpE [bacterium]
MTEKNIPIRDEEDGEKESGVFHEDGSSPAEGGSDSDEQSGEGESGAAEGAAASQGTTFQGPNLDGFDERDANFSALDGGKQNAGAVSGSAPEGAGDYDVLNAQLREVQEKYIRALADFENYKKRVTKERSDLLKYQGERVFVDLLPVVDNFDRALEASGNYDLSEDGKKLQEGFELIHKMFVQVLEKWQVKGESAVGEPFDPEKHEAISQLPSEEHDDGVIMNELEKAFYYKGKLIRHAKVVVSKAA